jgi:hypothetical protein
MLYVSISKIVLSNLPGTTFTRRSLSAVEVGDLIAQAQLEGALMGVSSDDLAAPYQKRSLDLYMEACDTLRACGVELAIKDFFGENFCNPLQFARVQGEHRLLIVEVGFEVNLPATSSVAAPELLESVEGQLAARVSKLFKVSPEAFRFHLFEEIAQ